MKLYKIKHLKTGLYSKGGLLPTWSKNGKTWTSLPHLKSHLTMVRKYVDYYINRPYCSDIKFPYDYSVVEEYEVSTPIQYPVSLFQKNS